MQTKRCSKCGEEKPLSEYHKCKRAKLGVQSRCKVCVSDLGKDYYQKNRDTKLHRQKQHNLENWASILAYRAVWRKKNPESAYKHRRENPGYYSSKESERRARKAQATPPWVTKEMQVEIQNMYNLRDRLNGLTVSDLEVDHVVPLNGKTVCGLHVPWNLQLLSKKANVSKGNRRWPDMWEISNG